MKRSLARLRDGRILWALLGVGALLTVISGSHLLGWELGTVADWVEAIGTAGALLIGAVALRQEVADRHDERERRLLDDARLVDLSSLGGAGKVGVKRVFTYSVRNSSPRFIYDVDMVVLDTDMSALGCDRIEDIGPGEGTAKRIINLVWVDPAPDRWHLTWRDDLGHRWLRTHRGEVRRITPSGHTRDTGG